MSEHPLASLLLEVFSTSHVQVACHEVTLTVTPHEWVNVAKRLRDDLEFSFSQCIDLCAVDYSEYGQSEWATHDTTRVGFDRGVAKTHESFAPQWAAARFAVVVHLLSIRHNQRLRVRTFLSQQLPQLDSLCEVWPVANWFEREAFDLFGILFKNHPDLRRILTDYGFIGHPFRKDFPLIGEVEARFDAKAGRVIYEPVSIESRVTVPRVVREDNRYHSDLASENSHE